MLRVICVVTVLAPVAISGAVEIYGVEMPEGEQSWLVKFDSNNVGGMRWVGGMKIQAVSSLEWVGSTLYAYSAGATPPAGLYRINRANGASTFIGIGGVDPGVDITDMSFNPRDGQLYALGAVRWPGSGTRLYTINTTNGYGTKVGNVTGLPFPQYSVGLAADLDGTMYIAELEADRMYKLTFGSLNATPLPEPVGFQLYDGGMTIDWAGDGRWHFAAQNFSPWRSEYRLVDKSTGATTLVGPFPNNPLITDLAIVPEPAALALLGVAALALRRR